MTEIDEDNISSQNKTPISYLQEVCTKKGITPQYDLVANEGAVHEPLFVFKVIAGEYVGTGKGPSKKKAKHNAAVSLLNQLVGLLPENFLDPEDQDKNEVISKLEIEDNNQDNPVGELQEATQKRMWPPPVYDYTNEQGPPHARQFICTVKIANFSEQAAGKSKKMAKKNVAIVMLERIKQGNLSIKVNPLHNKINSLNSVPQHDVLNNDFTSSYLANEDLLLSTISPLSNQINYNLALKKQNGFSTALESGKKKTSAMFLPGKRKLGPAIDSLQLINISEIDICKKLEEISLEQNFKIEYFKIPFISLKGEYQFLVKLTTNPITVCNGKGSSLKEAKYNAIRKTLEHLKILTNRPGLKFG